ncbi:hypothetical protein ES288_D03G152800v1 [Gossypium darwinii]|uniref:Secreted protein n=1 Tax=Gossypium darwinii TaxID=34276 RepID=A0A5D2D5Q3_GOSDA|nr:hypothetical protein ES288_D03G152800v1 [Gossypium darwinii]
MFHYLFLWLLLLCSPCKLFGMARLWNVVYGKVIRFLHMDGEVRAGYPFSCFFRSWPYLEHPLSAWLSFRVIQLISK